MLDRDIAYALTLPRSANDQDIALAVLEQGTRQPRDPLNMQPIPHAAAAFLTSLAEQIGQKLWDERRRISLRSAPEAETREALRSVDWDNSLAILAAIAPHRLVPAGPAGQMGRACRALLGHELPGFIRNIFAYWVETEHLTNAD